MTCFQEKDNEDEIENYYFYGQMDSDQPKV